MLRRLIGDLVKAWQVALIAVIIVIVLAVAVVGVVFGGGILAVVLAYFTPVSITPTGVSADRMACSQHGIALMDYEEQAGSIEDLEGLSIAYEGYAGECSVKSGFDNARVQDAECYVGENDAFIIHVAEEGGDVDCYVSYSE